MEKLVSMIEQFGLQYFKFANVFSMPQYSAKLEECCEHLGDPSGDPQRNDEYWKHVHKSL